MIPPTLTLESQVAPLRASLNMSDATTKKKTMDVVVREDPMYEALAPVYEVKREEEQEALTLPLVRQESFESLVAEASDAENTPVMASKIPRCPRPSRQYHVIHHGRRPSEINSAPCSPEKTHHGPVSAPSSRASSPTKSFVSNTKTRTAASPLKAPSHPPRMTKAALARNEATRKKIEQQKRKEQAHMNAMPVEIRRQSHPKKHVAQSVTNSDAILSMMSPEALESKEQISNQSIDAFLPKLNKSLESLQHNWDSNKIADVQSAAIQVHKSFSDQNHVLSMSFSEDPFYRELAKIDRSLTPQDLDLLRAALLKSEDLNHHLGEVYRDVSEITNGLSNNCSGLLLASVSSSTEDQKAVLPSKDRSLDGRLLMDSIMQNASETKENSTDDERIVISEVDIAGVDGELKQAAVEALKTKPNFAYTIDEVRDDVRRVFETGYFSSCRPKAEDTRDGVKLTIEVTPNPELRGLW
eukprot:jgi/Picre1/31376/NNA_006728.t1